MSPQMIDRLIGAFLDTLLMVSASAGIALVAGIPLAVFLVTSGPGGFFPAPRLNRALGALVNGFRVVPFIVLLVALIPFTRLVTGTVMNENDRLVIRPWASVRVLERSLEVFTLRRSSD